VGWSVLRYPRQVGRSALGLDLTAPTENKRGSNSEASQLLSVSSRLVCSGVVTMGC
jgi:hypothetical protein